MGDRNPICNPRGPRNSGTNSNTLPQHACTSRGAPTHNTVNEGHHPSQYILQALFSILHCAAHTSLEGQGLGGSSLASWALSFPMLHPPTHSQNPTLHSNHRWGPDLVPMVGPVLWVESDPHCGQQHNQSEGHGSDVVVLVPLGVDPRWGSEGPD